MSYEYELLWQPIDINGCRIRNRISMSGMGTFTPTLNEQYETESGLRYYEERARGGIGLLHTGAYFIDSMTAQGGRTLDFSTDKSIPSGTVLTERVHRWGAKMFAQLSCGTGRNGMPQIGDGRREDVRPCIVCNEECIGRIFGRLTQLSCTVNPATGLESYMEVKPVTKPENVVVIGAGPGGLEAARCAAERGCSVTVYEKADHIGGTFLTISTGSFKWRMPQLIEWYGVQLKKLGVKVVLNTEMHVDDPALAGADKIFVATGSKAIMPSIPGIEKVIDVEEIHRNGMPEGKRVVICGGGLSACDTAIEYGEKNEGRDITIVEMQSAIGNDVMVVNKISIDRLLKKYDVKQLTSTKVIGITDEGVEVENAEGHKVIPADVVVGAFGRGRNLELADAVQIKYPTKTTIIGDCMTPAKAGHAIREGFYAAMSIE